MELFFETKAAGMAMRQIKATRDFYETAIRLIEFHGREEEALTIFDLEDMIRQIPSAPPEFAIQVSELASNAGKEYVSAHELQRRADELTEKIFKINYLGYLLGSGKVLASELWSKEELQASGLSSSKQRAAENAVDDYEEPDEDTDTKH